MNPLELLDDPKALIILALLWVCIVTAALCFLCIAHESRRPAEGPHYRHTPEPFRVRKIREDV